MALVLVTEHGKEVHWHVGEEFPADLIVGRLAVITADREELDHLIALLKNSRCERREKNVLGQAQV